MIYITGDTHGGFQRFTTDNFPQQKKMGRDDYAVVAGDFGGVWDGSPREAYWLDWLEKKPFTTLFVDGNHENFEKLNALPVHTWHGGRVHYVRPHVIHLMRGQMYNIEGHTFFTMGGAQSHDIEDGILDPEAADFKETLQRRVIRAASGSAFWAAPGGRRNCLPMRNIWKLWELWIGLDGKRTM